MMVAERGRERSGGGKKKKSGGSIRVGRDHASEDKIRAKLRGNTGEAMTTDGNGDGVLLPVRNPDTGRPNIFLASENWVDLHFKQTDEIDEKGQAVSARYYDPKVTESALNSGATAQVRCEFCGHLTPPQIMEAGRCPDCQSPADHYAHGQSCSAVAIQRIGHVLGRPEKDPNADLLPEDEASLNRDIRRCRAGKYKPH